MKIIVDEIPKNPIDCPHCRKHFGNLICCYSKNFYAKPKQCNNTEECEFFIGINQIK